MSVNDKRELKPLFSMVYFKPNKRLTVKIRTTTRYYIISCGKSSKVCKKKKAPNKNRQKGELPGHIIATDNQPAVMRLFSFHKNINK